MTSLSSLYNRPQAGRLQNNTLTDPYFPPLHHIGRANVVLAGLLLAFVVLIGRLIWVMALPSPSRQTTTPAPIVTRANIVDRHGQILATNLITYSLGVHPKKVINAYESAQKLHKVFPDLSTKDIYRKLTSPKSFLWIKRNLTPADYNRVTYQGVVGLTFTKEQKRIYPHEKIVAHVVGYNNIDNQGLSGIERRFDKRLAHDATPLQLSIDLRVQHILRDALAKGMTEFRSLKGSAIMMDINTGEILGMVSLPDFDPHKSKSSEAIFNTNTLGIYEMGSLFKIFTFAMALDSKKFDLTSMFDASQPMSVGKFKVKDYRAKNRWLSFPEVFIYSSNIGTVKMALKMGADHQRKFFETLGFLKPLDLEIGERGVPQYPATWKEMNVVTISYGYGLAVSPIHLLNGIAAMVNGGLLRNPTLIKNGHLAHKPTRVIDPSTSDHIRRLMHLVVKQGSGRQADAVGYVVGGKTGSANKRDANGKYVAHNKHRGTFVAAYPMHEPRYIILVMMDEPQGNKRTGGLSTGGWCSAPVVKEVIEKTAPFLGIAPIDESSPKIQAAMRLDFLKSGSHRGIA